MKNWKYRKIARMVLIDRGYDVSVKPGQGHLPGSRLIAVKAAEAKLTNLRVTLPDRLGAKPLTGEYTLLISTVVGRAKPSYPVPVRDTARMLPMFIGPWRQIRIFCSPEAKEHHPVLRLLSSKSRESLERNAVTLG